MRILRLSFILFLLLGTSVLVCAMTNAQKNRLFLEYIKQYNEMAVDQMLRYKIPASITLAQGLLESGAGQSQLAKRSKNHFGIKCGGDWRGRTVRHTDDAPNECFRAYGNPKDSYEDHSKFLSGRARYASLFKLDITDYRGWARGLKKAGYATDPSYANRLIQIIEDYELYKYDKFNKRDMRAEKREEERVTSGTAHQVYLANGLLYVIARRGDTFKGIGDEFDTSARKLIKYNDLHKDYTLMPEDIIYLKAKKKKADKKYTVHVVGDGDSMHGISQRYGIRMKNLYKMNKKDMDDYVPEMGDRLRLR